MSEDKREDSNCPYRLVCPGGRKGVNALKVCPLCCFPKLERTCKGCGAWNGRAYGLRSINCGIRHTLTCKLEEKVLKTLKEGKYELPKKDKE
jgi:hypothetical protein